MLGPAKPRRLAEPIVVSLEGLVPQDHFYRHLEAKLDLSFMREWSRALYAERGRPGMVHSQHRSIRKVRSLPPPMPQYTNFH
jgi:hypothetical protein